MQPQIIPLTDPTQFKPAGVPWKTTDQARWAYRMRLENGLAEAFVTIGRRVHLNVPKFHELVGRNIA